jgi:hypothetical protein
MNKKEIAPGIVVYSNVIPEEINLISDIEDSVSAKVLSWTTAEVLEGKVKDVRDTDTIGVPYYDSIQEDMQNPIDAFNKSLSNLFLTFFKPVEDDYKSSYGIEMPWHDSYGILKYGLGQKFTNHIDDHEKFHRRMSTVYYANDNYSGGEINFPRFGISYKPKANEMIVFPSGYVYNHSVSEITDGLRYAVVSWLR